MVLGQTVSLLTGRAAILRLYFLLKKKVLDNLHNGAVILLHSTSKDNVAMLDSMIKEAKNMGYEFKSLDDFEK